MDHLLVVANGKGGGGQEGLQLAGSLSTFVLGGSEDQTDATRTDDEQFAAQRTR